MIRSVQQLIGFVAEHSERQQQALEEGDFVVVIGASDNAEADRIGEILASRGGRLLNHYTRWMGRTPVP